MILEELDHGAALTDIFTPPAGVTDPVMKFDYRRISARYICAANGRERLCTRYEETQSGVCKFKDDVFCRNF